MQMATPEGQIKKEICQWLEAMRCKPHVLQSVGIAGRTNNSRYSCKGISDVFTSWNKTPLFVEVKVPGKDATPKQQEFIDWALEQGWLAVTAHSVLELQEYLKS